MTTFTKRFTFTKGNVESFGAAWKAAHAFMAECDAAGIMAGHPARAPEGDAMAVKYLAQEPVAL